MTTIAFDGRYLAADTLGVIGGNRSERPSCKIQVSDGHAFATGGHWWAIRQHLIDWHAAGHPIADYPNPRGLDGCLVVVEGDTRQCKVFTHEAPYPDLEAAPVAFGTGGDIALGAMGAGLTAMEAVAIAARWDLKTGGPIDFIDLEHIGKGVQRWDGVMPSAKSPMPVDDGIVRDTHGTPIRDYAQFETVEVPKPVDCLYALNDIEPCGECWRCRQEAADTPQEPYRVTGNGMTARRVPDDCGFTFSSDKPGCGVCNVCRTAAGKPRRRIVTSKTPLMTREVVDELRKVRLTRQNCVHGMKPDTCSTCRANRTANLYPV